MSVDKSLKLSSRLLRHRSVLTRAERIAELRDREKWQEGQSVFGLPKVRVVRARKKPKAKAEAPAAAEGGEGAAAETTTEAAEGQPAQKKAYEKK